MSEARLEPSVWRRAIEFLGSRPAYAAGIRQVIAFSVPLAVGVAVDQSVPGMLAAVGAMITGIPALAGPYGSRLKHIGAATAVVCVVWIIGVLSASPLWLAITVAFLVIGAGALAVVAGNTAGIIGMLAGVVVVIAVGIATTPSLPMALDGAAAFAVGGAWSLLITAALWPFVRDRPEQAAVVAAYRSLADYTRAIFASNPDPSASGKAREAVSAAAESVRTTVVTTRRRQQASSRAWQRRAALSAALTSLYQRIVAVATAGEAWADDQRVEVGTSIADALDAIADAAATGSQPKTDDALERLGVYAGDAGDGAWSVTDLRDTLARIAHGMSENRDVDASRLLDRLGVESLRERIDDALSAVAGNLSWSSVPFRHALRVAVLASLALLIVRLLDLPHGYWMPMTVIVVLVPDYGATIVRGIQRLAGTFAGALIAVALIVWGPDPWISIGVIAVCTFIAFALMQINYGVSVAAITGLVLLAISVADADAIEVAELRFVLTAIASVLAIIGAAYLWPLWASRELPADLGTLLDADAALIGLVLDGLQTDIDPARYRDTRRNAARASANAGAGIQRMLTEPKSKQADAGPPIDVAVAGRRLIDVSVALALFRHAQHAVQAAGLDALETDLVATLRGAARAARASEVPADRPDLDALLGDTAVEESDVRSALGALVLQTQNAVEAVAAWPASEPDTAAVETTR